MSISKYLMDTQFRVMIIGNKVDIVNYQGIDAFDEEKIIIRHEDGIVILGGSSLTITKLLDSEMLISGKIEKIEFR